MSETKPWYFTKETAQALRAAQPRCQAKRRDGMPCGGLAVRGRDRCNAHGGGGKKPDRSRVAETARVLSRANRDPEVQALPEFQEFAAVRSRKYMVGITLALEAYRVHRDAVRWAADRAALLSGFRAAQERHNRNMERRYREREAAGIPHPADRALW